MRKFEKIFLQTGLKWNITQICILFVNQSAQASLNRFNIKGLGILAINANASGVCVLQRSLKLKNRSINK